MDSQNHQESFKYVSQTHPGSLNPNLGQGAGIWTAGRFLSNSDGMESPWCSNSEEETIAGGWCGQGRLPGGGEAQAWGRGIGGYFTQGWCRDSRPGSTCKEGKEVSSVRGQRHTVKSLETRPGGRRVVTTKGPDASLRSSIYSHNKHLLSTYCMLGTVSHTKHIDKLDGK